MWLILGKWREPVVASYSAFALLIALARWLAGVTLRGIAYRAFLPDSSGISLLDPFGFVLRQGDMSQLR